MRLKTVDNWVISSQNTNNVCSWLFPNKERAIIGPSYHILTIAAVTQLHTLYHKILLTSLIYAYIIIIHCVSEKKRQPFYFRIFVRCHPILPILGRNIPQGIWNKDIHSPPHLVVYVCIVPVKTGNDFYGIQYNIRYEVSTWESNCHIR